MPWLYNPTKDVHLISLQDGTSYGFLPKKKVYLEPGVLSSAVWQLVHEGRLVNRGGDPVQAETPVVKQQAVSDLLGLDPVVVDKAPEQPIVTDAKEHVVSHSILSEIENHTSSNHQEMDVSIAVESSSEVSEKEEKADEKQEDECEKHESEGQEMEIKKDDSPALQSDDALKADKRSRRFKRNK